MAAMRFVPRLFFRPLQVACPARLTGCQAAIIISSELRL